MLKTAVLCSTLLSAVQSKWTFTPVSQTTELQSSSYREDFARRALLLSYATYQPIVQIASWDCSYCQSVPEFQLNDIHVANDNTLLAFSGYDPVYNQIVFAFRGTVNTANWVTDADFVQVNYPGVTGGKVHRGFYKAWHNLQPIVQVCVEKLIKEHSHASLLVTGHSLGAGLAQMAALDIIKEAMSLNFAGKRSVVTFGSPRWGNSVMAAYFSSITDENWRLVNKHDVIPPLPPVFNGYTHTGPEVWYTSIVPLQYKICNSGEDPKSLYKVVDPTPTWEDHITYLNIRLIH